MFALKKNYIKAFVLITILSAIVLSACGGGPRVKMAPGYETTPAKTEVKTNVMGTPEATPLPPTPTPEPLTLDNTPYALPSQALSLFTPQGWVLKNEDAAYAKFESLDQRAWFEAAVESTGYQLSEEGFENYVKNVMISLYTGADGYENLDSGIEADQAAFISSYQKNGLTWYAYDFFIQRSQAIYALSFQVVAELWEAYLMGFQAVADRIETRTGYVTGDMLYRFMRSYIAPNDQFSLSIPMGWSLSRDQESIEGAVVDTGISPDGQASVEIITYAAEQALASQDIGQIAISIMKQLDGENLRIRASNVLDDERIRLDWQVNESGMYGFTFFWLESTDLYILTLKYSDEYPEIYQNVLVDIGDSYRSPVPAN